MTCHAESCSPKGVHNAAGFLAGTLALGRPTLEQYVSDGQYPMERTHAGAVFEELYSVGFRLEQFVQNCIPWERPHDGAGEECEEEGAAQN